MGKGGRKYWADTFKLQYVYLYFIGFFSSEDEITAKQKLVNDMISKRKRKHPCLLLWYI